MTKFDDERFVLRPRPPRSRDAAAPSRFLSRVRLEVRRVGGTLTEKQRPAGGRASRFGRGFAAARLVSGGGVRQRRVIVKAQLVHLRKVSAAHIAAHFRYIARNGLARDAETPLEPYNASVDRVDVEQFQSRSAGDRHQFRFIVAPEDSIDLADLKAFTRDLMRRVEADLGTSLDWVAVDHWDTDNPHTHLVIRGRDCSGRDLVIAGDYIAHGMRARAREIATLWLGPRTDLEIQASLRREVEQERWTSLDEQLKARTHEGRVDLGVDEKATRETRRQQLLLGRLQRLQTLGLARRSAVDGWELRDDVEEVLRRLGERGDIIRTMQRAFGAAERELVIFDPKSRSVPIVGRIADKGLVDGLSDRAYVVIDGVDGRGHHVTLPSNDDIYEVPVGAIVEVSTIHERPADRNVLAASKNGLYVRRDHLMALRANAAHREQAADIVHGHERRLEALRRAGIVERVGDGVWRVPPDLVARGQAYDRRQSGGLSVAVRSQLSIERQVQALGATWLDEQLVSGERPAATVAFGATVRDALEKRSEFLVDQGLAKRDGPGVTVRPDALQALRDRELAVAANRIAADTGLSYRPLKDGGAASGVYRRSVQLVSGRFAMLDDGLGFTLVPWKPVIEPRLGQALTAVLRSGHVSWQFGRSRGP